MLSMLLPEGWEAVPHFTGQRKAWPYPPLPFTATHIGDIVLKTFLFGGVLGSKFCLGPQNSGGSLFESNVPFEYVNIYMDFKLFFV